MRSVGSHSTSREKKERGKESKGRGKESNGREKAFRPWTKYLSTSLAMSPASVGVPNLKPLATRVMPVTSIGQ